MEFFGLKFQTKVFPIYKTPSKWTKNENNKRLTDAVK